MAEYRSKPITVEAIQWTGDNAAEVLAFVNDHSSRPWDMDDDDALEYNRIWVAKSAAYCDLSPGSFVVAEPDVGVYPCEAAVFEARWEPVS